MLQVEKTMASIRHTLTERWYAWENARQVAMEDEEVNLYADSDRGEQAYLPKEPELDHFGTGNPHAESRVDASYPPPLPYTTEGTQPRV